MTNVFVDPAHRGSGLGGRLLDALRAHARAERFDTLVVCPSERSAFLYRRHGFALPRCCWSSPSRSTSPETAPVDEVG
ncbi:GNAT family N-acetyltransferase [Kribbella sp. NPDC055071]